MTSGPSGSRIWLALGHTDMRRGMRSLARQVQKVLKKDVHAGDLYVFRGRNGKRRHPVEAAAGLGLTPSMIGKDVAQAFDAVFR